ncbi:hypothetical protein CCR75_009619 [Bremia lactucae]|uniref:Uncharacterized protein n=1 Tax=Bremia lactucae TaxID=4779 RepID=A0A976FM08_BRELC|nr:hypothetical protein CCR75_009619 [Bremia lactucae]
MASSVYLNPKEATVLVKCKNVFRLTKSFGKTSSTPIRTSRNDLFRAAIDEDDLIHNSWGSSELLSLFARRSSGIARIRSACISPKSLDLFAKSRPYKNLKLNNCFLRIVEQNLYLEK